MELQRSFFFRLDIRTLLSCYTNYLPALRPMYINRFDLLLLLFPSEKPVVHHLSDIVHVPESLSLLSCLSLFSVLLLLLLLMRMPLALSISAALHWSSPFVFLFSLCE